MKSLFVFDLDGTLAESKSPLDPVMAGLLSTLLGFMKVAVISGGSWEQFHDQLLGHLAPDGPLENLYLLPTCGTKFYHFVHQWELLYSEDLSDEERRRIVAALQQALSQSGLSETSPWGDIIEDRGTQITMSALGQQAPLSAKEVWDPDFAKRTRIASILQPLLPNFAINMGGTTSIDITRPGIDKAYGIRKLRDELGIPLSQMLFAGDALFEGGNDYPAQLAGVDSLLVRDTTETKRVIQTVIACLGDGSVQITSPGRPS
jgi:HAD superfamily hydrolase (TIGR01484 family)